MRKNVAYTLTAVALAAFVAGPAFAESLPSAKSTVAMGALYPLVHSSAIANPDTTSGSDDTGWVPVMRTYIKTGNLRDLAFDMALQCGLVTYTQVKSKGGDKDTANASGRIRVRIKVTDADGNVRYAEPNEQGNENLGVTYCYRFQELSAVFQGLIEECIDPAFGTIRITDDCLQPEEVSLLLETLSANAFNFLMTDVPAGVHQVDVEAKASATAGLFDAKAGSAKGEAFIGLGSLHVDESRLIKDATGWSEPMQ